MLNWLRRRRLSSEARRKLIIFTARAEEALIETHVQNLLDLIDTLGGEVDLDRAINIYIETMSLQEPLASTITTRLLSSLESPKGTRFRNVFRSPPRKR